MGIGAIQLRVAEGAARSRRAAALTWTGQGAADVPVMCGKAISARMRWSYVVLTAACLVLVTGERAAAQQADVAQGSNTSASGLTITPYISLATVYDDNIFASATLRESDTIFRLSPGIALRYSSSRTNFRGSYTDDAEQFSRHSDLSSWQARQSALFRVDHAFTQRLSAGFRGNYLETYYPGELTPVSGVELTRTRATQVSLMPTLTYRFSPLMSMTSFFHRSREHLAGGETTYTSTASASLHRNVTQRDRLSVTYQSIWYNFSSGTSPLSRVLTVGWEHNLTPQTTLFITAGPRDTSSRTVAEVIAGIRHDTQRTSAALTYTRSQFVVAGQSGLYDTHAIEASFAYRPSQWLSFGVRPGYYRNTGNGQQADIYRIGLDARYWFAQDWSVAFSYDYGRQKGVLSSAANDLIVRRNVVALMLTWALPSGSAPASLPSSSRRRMPVQMAHEEGE